MSSPVVAILGATGKSGQWGLKGALQRGYTTRVLARNPDKVAGLLKTLFGESEGEEQLKKIIVVKGGIRDEAALEELITGADCVLSYLGMPASKVPTVQPGVEQMLATMKKTGSRAKLVSMSAMGIRDSGDQTWKSHWFFGPLTLKLVIPYMLKECFADMEAAELLLEAERGVEGGVITTIVRAPVLKDGPPRVDYTDKSQQNYVYAESSKTSGIRSWRLDRQDAAAGLLDCVESEAMDNKTITVLQK